MAHFAKLGSNSRVIQVLTLNNGDMLNADGVEDESVGQQYLERHNNWPAQMWIQTSYNTSGGKHSSGDDSKALRGNYAGIGHIWDEDNNLFYPKKPYPSWVLNTTTASWDSPIGDAPDDLTDEEKAARTHYVWNEDAKSWDKTPEA
jgi:hypothetical protein